MSVGQCPSVVTLTFLVPPSAVEMGEKDHSHSPCTVVELGDSTRACHSVQCICQSNLATNEGKCKWLLLVPSLVGPLSVFHYLLTEVAGCRLDAHCNPSVVMRFVCLESRCTCGEIDGMVWTGGLLKEPENILCFTQPVQRRNESDTQV